MILYVDDNRILLLTVKDTLELEGWHIDTCADGLDALAKIESRTRFDLLLLDNDLPGVGGLELTRRARDLKHRQHTPIIVISADEIEAEARRAGADEFLRKPNDIHSIVETISRLLAPSRKK